ncbi:MAG: hypothetical protein WEA09_13490 [Gemmatimonadota bacterium]
MRRSQLLLMVWGVMLMGCAGEELDAPQPGEIPDTAQAPHETAPAFVDPDVARLYARMMDAIAPNGGWERARYLEFDRGGAGDAPPRRHRWDRWEGNARWEAVSDAGTVVALFNANDPQSGRVWLEGEELAGDERERLLTSAYRSHINDGYWLLMPFKWGDPGVSSRYLGQREALGRSWDVVELAFDEGVGLTPRNMYHAFLSQETGRMEYWHHFSNPDADPSPSEWTDWRQVGPLVLAENRRVDGEIRSRFPHLRVETEVPEGVFDPPGG